MVKVPFLRRASRFFFVWFRGIFQDKPPGGIYPPGWEGVFFAGEDKPPGDRPWWVCFC